MKIERINENQIRCTLTGEDLAKRQIKISELAYGSDKARQLFQEMMQQANYELGFEAEDIPLMIEAIPLSGGSILLNVTKMEYPEELDTRFSNFTPSAEDSELYDDTSDSILPSEAADSILDLFRQLGEAAGLRGNDAKKGKNLKKAAALPQADTKKEADTPAKPLAPQVPADIVKLFCFSDITHVLRLSRLVHSFYHGKNSLYLDELTHRYYLLVHKSDHTPSDFNKVCNILSEYAIQHPYYDSAKAFFDEHFSLIVSDNALDRLAASTES